MDDIRRAIASAYRSMPADEVDLDKMLRNVRTGARERARRRHTAIVVVILMGLAAGGFIWTRQGDGPAPDSVLQGGPAEPGPVDLGERPVVDPVFLGAGRALTRSTAPPTMTYESLRAHLRATRPEASSSASAVFGQHGILQYDQPGYAQLGPTVAWLVTYEDADPPYRSGTKQKDCVSRLAFADKPGFRPILGQTSCS